MNQLYLLQRRMDDSMTSTQNERAKCKAGRKINSVIKLYSKIVFYSNIINWRYIDLIRKFGMLKSSLLGRTLFLLHLWRCQLIALVITIVHLWALNFLHNLAL